MMKGLVPTYLKTGAKHPRGEFPGGDGPGGAGAVSELAPVIIVIIIIQCRSATIPLAAGRFLVHFVARRVPAPDPVLGALSARYFIIPSNGPNCVCFFTPTATLICLLQLPAIEAEDL